MKSAYLVLTILIAFVLLGGYFIAVKNFRWPLVTSPPTALSNISDCVVLEQKFCSQGNKVLVNDKFYGVGFKTFTGTKVYAPFDGQFVISEHFLVNGQNVDGSLVVSLKSGTSEQDFHIMGKVTDVAQDIVNAHSHGDVINIRSGQYLETIGSDPVPGFSGYNLVLSFRSYDSTTKLLQANFQLSKKFFGYLNETN